MKKVLTFFISFFVIIGLSQAQSLSPTVIASQGAYSEGQQISLQWTIGESFVETTRYRSILFTEGFNQPFLNNGDQFSNGKSTADNSSNSSSIFGSLEFEAYPNPFQNYLNLSVTGTLANDIELRLVDVSGMILKRVKITPENPNSTITGEDLPAAVYLIHLIDESTGQTEIFRVLKQY